MSGPRLSRAGAYPVAAIGLLLFGAGVQIFVSRTFALATWTRADAVVTASGVQPIGANRYDAHIRVRFEAGGRTVETEVEHDYRRSHRGWVADAAQRHAPGTSVAVLYAPCDPRRARLAAGGLTTFGISLLLIAFGSLFASVGWLALRDVDRAEEEVGTTEHGRGPAADRTRTVLTGGYLLASGLGTVHAAATHFTSASCLLVPGLLLALGMGAALAGVRALRLSRR